MNDLKQILVVDDDQAFLDSFDHILKGQRDEWALTMVSSLDTARDALNETPFDCIIADLHIAGNQCLDLLKDLKNEIDAVEIPFIVMTGDQDIKLKRLAAEMGATDFIAKPIIKEDLFMRLTSNLRLKTYQDKLYKQNEQLEKLVKERTNELLLSRKDIVWRLAKAGEYRDDMTGKHVARVSCYSRLLAEALNLDDIFIENISLASSLHDIGKIGIPDAILLKPGKLTVEEREIISQHCEIGAHILKDPPEGYISYLKWQFPEKDLTDFSAENPILDMAVTIALGHHEKYDGTGYPAKLAGKDITLEARIVAVADVYDALRSDRPYKEGFSAEDTNDYIYSQDGKHFDPEICQCFYKLKDKFNEIFTEFPEETLKQAH